MKRQTENRTFKARGDGRGRLWKLRNGEALESYIKCEFPLLPFPSHSLCRAVLFSGM